MRPIPITTFLSWTFVRSHEANGQRVEVRKDDEGREWQMSFALPPSRVPAGVRPLRTVRGYGMDVTLVEEEAEPDDAALSKYNTEGLTRALAR